MNFDVTLPLTLLAVSMASMFLDKRVEGKLRSSLEEKEFRIRDSILLVAMIGITVSLMVFIPQIAVMILFLFSYSMLLFMFTFFFSDFSKLRAEIFCSVFLIADLLVVTTSLIIFGINRRVIYGVLGFSCLFGFTLVALWYEKRRESTEERWYLAVLPPAFFIGLYLFFSRTGVWFPFLLDSFGVVFAILITLYLGSLFRWKTSLIFVILLTILDIILVLGTGSMISAAKHVSGLRLPMLISVPAIPASFMDGGRFYMSLGLGDFFFAGLISIQTLRRFGRRTAVLSVIAISISFFVFEAVMLTYQWTAFPGTLMIICGWIPVMIWKKIYK